MKVARDILIGKAAAVIGGWVLKNALAMTIAIKKSKMLGVKPDQLYDPKFIKDNHLQLESLVMALMPFLVLLTFSASLGFWAQQGGWGGFVSAHAGLGRGLAEIQRDISMASSTAASLASSTARALSAERVTGAGVAFEHQVQHGLVLGHCGGGGARGRGGSAAGRHRCTVWLAAHIYLHIPGPAPLQGAP